jgi:hypothetical protein
MNGMKVDSDVLNLDVLKQLEMCALGIYIMDLFCSTASQPTPLVR